MTIDIVSLHKAIAQLQDALDICASDLAKSDTRLALHLHAAAIQAFEFTYELSYKTLKRYLEAIEPSVAEIEAMDFNNVIRRGYERGLLSVELAIWKGFRTKRGTTSHAYDQEKAAEVFAELPAFLSEAKFLAAQIDQRQSASE